MAADPHDDVIVDDDPHRRAGVGDGAGDSHVGAAGGGIARGVIVDHAKQYYKCLFFQT